MASILVVHERSELARQVARELSEGGHVVRESTSRREALGALTTSPADLVLCEAGADACAGTDGWIVTLRRAAPSTAALYLIPAADAALDAGAAPALRAPNVVWAPYTPAAVVDLARRTLDARRGFLGTVSGLGLIEVLQAFHLGRRTARLVIDGSAAGWIDFDRGDPVDAECEDATGVSAMRRLLAARGGRFRSSPAPATVRRTIHSPFDTVMMDLLRGACDDDNGAPAADPLSLCDDLFAGLDALRSWAPPASPDLPSGVSLAAPPAPSFTSLTPLTEAGDDTAMNNPPSATPLDEACRQVVEQIDGAAACGVLDLDSGVLLGAYTTTPYDPALVDSATLAITDLFRGPHVTRVAQLALAHSAAAADGDHAVREVYIAAGSMAHFLRGIKSGRVVLALVLAGAANIGLGWSQLRAATPRIEALVP